MQDLARFLQKRVILQDLARWRLSCKNPERGRLSCKNLARILQDNHPKISVVVNLFNEIKSINQSNLFNLFAIIAATGLRKLKDYWPKNFCDELL